MSDPRFRDPRLEPVPPRDAGSINTERLERETSAERMDEIESSNAMWGWIAGGVVVTLLLLFIFGRSPNTTNTAEAPAAPKPVAVTDLPCEPIDKGEGVYIFPCQKRVEFAEQLSKFRTKLIEQGVNPRLTIDASTYTGIHIVIVDQ